MKKEKKEKTLVIEDIATSLREKFNALIQKKKLLKGKCQLGSKKPEKLNEKYDEVQ